MVSALVPRVVSSYHTVAVLQDFPADSMVKSNVWKQERERLATKKKQRPGTFHEILVV